MAKKILLIESDDAFRRTLVAALSARGFEATEAGNSDVGLQMAKSSGPDLIVVCVEAQPTNGYMVCTKLKKDDGLKQIPVILTSSSATPESFEKHKKLKTRAEDYLIKPFTADALVHLAGALIGMPDPAAAGGGDEGDELVALEDESISLADLGAEASGEEEESITLDADGLVAEPLSDEDAAEAHTGGTAGDGGENDLEMFDQAFDALGGGPGPNGAEPPPAPANDDLGSLVDDDLQVASDAAYEEEKPEPASAASTSESEAEEEAALASLMGEVSEPAADFADLSDEPTGTHAIPPEPPDANGVVDELGEAPSELAEEPAAAAADSAELEAAQARTAELEARVQELELSLSSKENELASAKSAPAGGGTKDIPALRTKIADKDKEILRLRTELNEKDRELLELNERHASMEEQVTTLSEAATKKDATAKALSQRADALAAAAKKYERELTEAKKQAAAGSASTAKVAELDKQLAEAKKAAAAELEDLNVKLAEAQSRAEEAQREMDGVREVHESEALELRAELERVTAEAQAKTAEADESHTQLEEARAIAVKAGDEAAKLKARIAEFTGELAHHKSRAEVGHARADRLREAIAKAIAADQPPEEVAHAVEAIDDDEIIAESGA